jgi:hypothetical protein
MRISVFGSSAPQPDSAPYNEALRLGQLLGSAGHTVLTGGYMGTMEAVSRGTAESGGHVIGVTCDEIETWRPTSANAWVEQELRFPTLRKRLFTLIEACDAALALPGGGGTLAEITMMWTHMQTEALPARPLILIGAGWRTTFGEFYQSQAKSIAKRSRDLLCFATTVEEAYQTLVSLTA